MKYYILFILLFPINLLAQDHCSSILKAKKPLLTLYTEHWPPYQRVEDNGHLSGISVAKIEQVLTAAQWPYKMKVVPWARAMHNVKNEPNSFIFSLARFPERENKFQWLVPLAEVKSKILRLNDAKEITINTLDDVKKYRIILKRGEASSTLLIDNKLVDKDNVIWVSHSSQALKLLSIGRGDIYPETVNSFDEAINSSSFHGSQFSSVYDFTALDVTLYLATAKTTNKSLVDNLSKAFQCESFALVNNQD